MKHLEKISRSKQKKPTSSPRGQIGKIITLSLIGAGAYLLLSRQKAFAEEIPEEYTPSEKPQDQLTKELYEQLSPSTIVEKATEIATVAIKEATEKANIEIQQIKEATATTIAEIIKKADEDLEALKREMEASTMRTEDLIKEYRARDEVIRAEAEQKIELARIEAEKKDQAARDEAARQVEIARIEAEQKVQAARIEIARIEAARLAEIEAAKKPKQVWKGWIDQGHLMAIDDEGFYRDCSWAWAGQHGDCYRNWKVDFVDSVIEGQSCEGYPLGTIGRGLLRNACAYQNQRCYRGYFSCSQT